MRPWIALLLLAGCADAPVGPAEPFTLDATFASEPQHVGTFPLGDEYGGVMLRFTSEPTDSTRSAHAIDAWRFRMYGGDTLHAELDRGAYASDDGIVVRVEGVEWLAGRVVLNGTTATARASWLDYRDPSTFVDVALQRR